jgi:hypothetical protein
MAVILKVNPHPGAVLLTLVLCLTGACSQPVLQDEVSDEFAAQNLYPVKNSGFLAAFVRPDADLGGYRVVDMEPLEVSQVDIPTTSVAGTLRRDWEMSAERASALQAAWAAAMEQAFSAYARGRSGPGVLRIAARLTRIAPGRPSATTIGGSLQAAGSTRDVVEISAEFRLSDADSGELLAVIRDSRTLTSAAMARTAPVTVALLFRSWAALLHTRVSGR